MSGPITQNSYKKHHQKHLQWAYEHQNWTMEQWKKVTWSEKLHFLYQMDGRVCVCVCVCVCVWPVFCWETLGPAIVCRCYFDTYLCHLTYLKIIVEHIHPFMAMVFPIGSGLFQQHDAPCHTAKIVQEWFEQHD